MADLVTRIILDNKQFNDNIQQSKKQLQTFTNFSDTLKTSIGKLAGGIGVAVTATEAFTKAMNSNKTVQDNFITLTQGMQESVDDFFSALVSGDWTVFEGGIDKAIKKGQQYVKTLRLLRQSLNIGQFAADELEANRDKAEVKLTQKGLSKEERTAAYEEFVKTGTEYRDELQRTYEFSWKQLQTALATKGVKFSNVDELRKAYAQYLNPASLQYSQLQQYKADKERVEGLGTQMRGNAGQYDTYYRTPEAKAAKKEFDDTYKGRINDFENLVRFENLFTEERAEEFQNYIDNITQFNSRIAEANKTLADGKVDFEDTLKKEEESKQQQLSVNVKPIIPEGSLKELNEQISNVTERISLAVDNNSRIALYAELKQLEEKKRVIEFQYKYPDSPDKAEENGLYVLEFNSKDIKLPTFTKKDVEINNNYAESLNAIATLMNSVTQMTNDSASAWISWSANVLTAVATAIPAIQTLVTAKTAEAGASAAASAAQTPVVGWILAGAAVASVLASLAALPKFEEGGIVGGNSFTGDNILARVNSGEMILNSGQQANLFSMLNNKTNINSNVEFVIKGQQLVGVLNNYNNKFNKTR
ncbi:hypothetical protein [Phocaeicola barnesiae]|uniref:Uncharacterized protein n=1 Tax=Phocaeicola barnesiae TaxID=376804 RepID=A0AAW5N6E6_9BACT|nr:hypothetical protein [Phocaeicola barnesiae]MCR8874892.1 hypothetical protein [Phocaeicola barnesiae]